MIPPLENIRFMALVWAATAVIAFALSSSHLLDGPSDIDAEQATEAARQDALNDAIAQAQAERPELWAAEHKARARVAAQIVVRQP